MRAVIYCRCSTEEERQVDALKKQVIEAEVCVSENGWELVDSYVESKSGTTSKGRREYLRLYADLLGDRFDIIVIKSQDRLMRNTKDWYLFLDRMQMQGKKLYLYIERKFFTTEDSLITGIKAILAEEFSRELSKKIVNAHRNRQKNGTNAVLTNRTFGYVKHADGSVTVDAEHREDVIRIFQYVERYGCRTTANLLEKEDVKSKQGNYMTPATIRRMVRNPIYKGICVMNKTHFDFDTKMTVKNSESEWVYAGGIVPAIVDEELWQRANEAISRRAVDRNVAGSYPIGSNQGKYSLSGKLKCGICGKPYYRSWRRGHSEVETIIYEWKCSRYVQHGRNSQRTQVGCDNVHLEEVNIYAVLEDVNKQYFQSNPANKSDIIAETIRLLEQCLTRDESTTKFGKLEQENRELSCKKQFLMEKLLDEVISDDDYRRQNRILEKRIQKNELKLQELRRNLNDQESMQTRLNHIKQKLEQGGFEKAATSQMLDCVREILVHEWQLEIRFDSLSAAEVSMTSEQRSRYTDGHMEDSYCVFMDYPFSPHTERGRYLDRMHIMEMLKVEPTLTAKVIAKRLGRSQHMVRSRMEELKKEGYIRFAGKGGRGVWEILKELRDTRIRYQREIT